MGSLLTCLCKPNIDDRSSRKTFNKLDTFTKVMMKPLRNSILATIKEPYVHSDIVTYNTDLGWEKNGNEFSDWKKKAAKATANRISDSFSVNIIKEDDTIGKMPFPARILFRIMRFRLLFPVTDKPGLFFKSNEDAQRLLNSLKITMGEGGILPQSYNTWEDMTTDDSLTRIFFYGIGAILMATQPDHVNPDFGVFVVNMSLETYKTRRGFRPLGATIYFDADQKPSDIFDHHQKKHFKPGESGWEAAKFLVRVTVGTLITVREHLVWSHLIISNSVTRASINHLPPCHPIRRLLTIFTFLTNKVNRGALQTLTTKAGILHRATGFTYESMKEIFDASYKQSNIFEPFGGRKVCSSVKKLSDEGKFPYLSEGIAYYKIIYEFVQEWLNTADMGADVPTKNFYDAVKKDSKGQTYELPNFKEDGDMLVNLLSQMIFVVTAYHELAGGMVDYVRLPTRVGFRCTNNATQLDVQTFLLAIIIAGGTSVRMPKLMQDFNNFFGAGGAPSWERDVWKTFKSKIEIQSDNVKQANANRDTEFNAFDPDEFECSISV